MSKEFEEGDSSRFGNSITGAGTLAYASPEQLSEKQIRRNTDLWSFGIIAFQLLTGELPFNTGSHPATSSAGRIELFRQINSGIIPPTINVVAEPWQRLIRKLLIVDPNTRPRSCADVRKIIVGDFDETKANETVSPSDETISENSQQKQTVIVDETIRENAYSNQQFEDSTYREQNFNTTNSDVTQQPITNEDSECIVDSHIPDLSTKHKRHVWVMKILGQSVLLTFITVIGNWLYNGYFFLGGLGYTICYFLSSFLFLLILNYVLSQRAKLTTKKSLQKRRITEQIIFIIFVFSNCLFLALFIYSTNLLVYLSPLTYTVLYLPYIDTPKKRIIFGIISGISILTLILLPFIDFLWY